MAALAGIFKFIYLVIFLNLKENFFFPLAHSLNTSKWKMERTKEKKKKTHLDAVCLQATQ